MASDKTAWPMCLLATGMLGLIAAATSSGVIILVYLLECAALFVCLCYARTWGGWNRISRFRTRCLRLLIIASPIILLFVTFWTFALIARWVTK